MQTRGFVIIVALAITGCGLVLGLEDKSPYPPDGGALDGATLDAPTSDAGAGGDGGAGDASTDPCAKCGFTKCVDGGTCEAFTLATTSHTVDGSIENPLAVAVFQKRVFWSTNRGSVYACERDNCPATTIKVAIPGVTAGYATEDKVYTLLADDTSVYWAQYYTQRIFRAPHDGGTVESFDARGYPSAMVADQDNLYWTNFGAGTSALWRCRKSICFTQPSATIFMSNPYVAQTKPSPFCTEAENRCWFATSLADNDTTLAFIDGKADVYGDIFSISKTAVDAGVKAWSNAEHPFPNPTSVTAHNGTIYFAAARGSANAVAIPGNITALTEQYNPNPIVSGADETPTSLTTDGIDLFWYAYGTGAIRSCGIAGCGNNPTTLANKQPGAQSLVVSDNVLYWVNSESVEVQMLVVR